jgi:hypothetical protein
LSLAITLLVFTPGKANVDYYDPKSVMQMTINRAKEKRTYLIWGIFLFVIGIISMPMIIALGLN